MMQFSGVAFKVNSQRIIYNLVSIQMAANVKCFSVAIGCGLNVCVRGLGIVLWLLMHIQGRTKGWPTRLSRHKNDRYYLLIKAIMYDFNNL